MVYLKQKYTLETINQFFEYETKMPALSIKTRLSQKINNLRQIAHRDGFITH